MVYKDEWSESLENDLCMLWDMTAEIDVVLFLKDNDFLKIAECTLKISKEPRLTEITLGIIGNMCCQPRVIEALGETDTLVSLIFGLLSSDDTEVIVQILRLFQSTTCDIDKHSETKWLKHLKDCEFLNEAPAFMLQSSTNNDLLIAAPGLFQSISIARMLGESCLLSDLIKVVQLVPAFLDLFDQLIRKNDSTYSRIDLKFIEN